VLIHPFDHEDIVAGQGTVGLEIAEQCPDVRTVVVCTGGGGLVAGIAVALKALLPGVRVVAAQAAGAASYTPSLEAGAPMPLAAMTTMADGIAVGCPGELPFAIVRELVDDVVTVDEEALSRALLLALERAKLVVEPAGAAALAAVMEDPTAFEPPVVAVLSGGNIDRCSCRRSCATGWWRRAGSCPCRCRSRTGPVSWRDCSACSATAARTSWTSSTPAPARACTSTRSRWACSSRRAAGRTATRCWRSSPKRLLRQSDLKPRWLVAIEVADCPY
jgi:hypothetical protein